jgi:hypothetical protein
VKFMRSLCWVWMVTLTTVILFNAPVSVTRDHYLYGSHHITEDFEHIGPFGAPFYLSGPSVTRSSIDFSRLIVALLAVNFLPAVIVRSAPSPPNFFILMFTSGHNNPTLRAEKRWQRN